mmetsp:Transcript_27848/g.31919  ORF Transcript_27848/g.31919 Transcript_27848/m.31919 type:complete len:223 (+) Transcript_27848:84-752(+)
MAKDEIVSDATWLQYVENMFPARPLTGKLLDLLSKELEAGFTFDPTKPGNEDEEDGFDPQDVRDNVCKFCKLCAQEHGNDAGLAWVNALHQFRTSDKGNEHGQFTPLTYVCYTDSDDWRMVRTLLEIGADPNLRSGIGQTPLFMVINNFGRLRTANLLLESGANAMAEYAGKNIASWAKVLKNGEELDRRTMIWESIKQKCNIYELDEDDMDEDSECSSMSS